MIKDHFFFQGKGLFATCDIPANSIIFEEEPLVCCQFAWNEAYGYKCCNHCLTPLETAEENARRLTGKPELVLPYPQCCQTKKDKITECENCKTLYCSVTCKNNAANQYHRNICSQIGEKGMLNPLEKLIEAWKEIHYPPETSNIMLVVRILMLIQQSSNKDEITLKFTNFCHRMVNEDADLAHKLVGEQFVGQIDLLLTILKQVVNPDGIEQWITPDGFRTLLALIGTNGQGVATSAISTWVKNCTNLKISGKKIDRYSQT